MAESTHSELNISNGGQSCSNDNDDGDYRNTLLTPARLIAGELSVVMRIDSASGWGSYFGWARSSLRLTWAEHSWQGFFLESRNGKKWAEGGIHGVECGLAGFDKVGTVISMVYRPSAGEILFRINNGGLKLLYSGVSGDLRPAILFFGKCAVSVGKVSPALPKAHILVPLQVNDISSCPKYSRCMLVILIVLTPNDYRS